MTGQGIHTDGADRAMLVCLHRGDKIEGAENVFHASLDGMEPLCEELPLQNREGLYFKDNSLYHTVTRAAVGKYQNLEQVSRTPRQRSTCKVYQIRTTLLVPMSLMSNYVTRQRP